MKKYLLLLFLSLGLIGSANASTVILICDTKSVEITEFGARTTFPGSTKTVTMVLEVNKSGVIANLTIKEILTNGNSFSSKYSILKQDDKALTALGSGTNSHGAEILFLNKQDGRFSIAHLVMSAALGTTGRCYE